MKLIDILKKDLESWPQEASYAIQDPSDGMVKFAGEGSEYPQYDGTSGDWRVYKGQWCSWWRASELAEDRWTSIVTKEQFMSASNPWGGEGVPPVGELFKYISTSGSFGIGRMLYCGKDIFLVRDVTTGKEKYILLDGCLFEKIIDKPKDMAVTEMISATSPCGSSIKDICEQIYNAIAEGKIPGLHAGGK